MKSEVKRDRLGGIHASFLPMRCSVGTLTGESNQWSAMGSPGPYAPTRIAHLNGLTGKTSTSPKEDRLDRAK